MTRPLPPTLLMAAVLALSLAGCGTHDEGSDVNQPLTVEEAKAVAQSVETELAAFIPPDIVVSVDQRPFGVLLRCRADGSYQWTGATTVRIAPGKRVDAKALTSEIVAAYDGRNSFVAAVEQTSDGEPRAHIVGPDSAGYLVSEDPDRAGVRIASFSPCFELQEGLSPGGSY